MPRITELIMECLDCDVEACEVYWDGSETVEVARHRLRLGHEDHAVLWDVRFGPGANGSSAH